MTRKKRSGFKKSTAVKESLETIASLSSPVRKIEVTDHKPEPLELCTLAMVRIRKYFTRVPDEPARRCKLRSYIQATRTKAFKRKLTDDESNRVIDAVGIALGL